MKTVPLLACFLAMILMAWIAQLDDNLNSNSFWFALSVVLVCAYSAVSQITNRKATEEQILKSCQATAAEQATSRLEELKGLQATISSRDSTITTLQRNISAHRHKEAESSKKAADNEREIRRLRQRVDENKDLAKDGNNVRLILSEWEIVKVSLAKAGIDSCTHPGGWRGAIEELCQPKAKVLSAVEGKSADMSSALDKKSKEFTQEKAAKEAEQKKVNWLQERLVDQEARARIAELENQQMKIDAERNERRASHHAEKTSSELWEEAEASVRSDFEQRLGKYQAETVAYHEYERANLTKKIHELNQKHADLESEFWHEVAKSVAEQPPAEIDDSEELKKVKKSKNTMKRKLKAAETESKQAKEDLSKATSTIKMHETTIDQLNKKLGDEVVQKVGKEEDAISKTHAERSKKLQEQLEEERTASKGLKENLTTAEGIIDELNDDISSLSKELQGMEKTAASAEASAKLSNKLQQELTEAETRIVLQKEQLAEARSETDDRETGIDIKQAELDDSQAEVVDLTQQLATSQEEVASCRCELDKKNQSIKDRDETIRFMFQPDPSAEQAAIDASMFALDQSSQAMAEPVVVNNGFGQQQQNDDDEAMRDSGEDAAGPSDSDQMQGDIDHTMSGNTGSGDTSTKQPLVAPAAINFGEYTSEDMNAEGIDPGKDTTEPFDPKAFIEDEAIKNCNYGNNGMDYYADDQGHGGNDGSDGLAGDQDMSIANNSNGAPDSNACIDPRLLMMDNASSVTIPAQGLTPSTAAPAQQPALSNFGGGLQLSGVNNPFANPAQALAPYTAVPTHNPFAKAAQALTLSTAAPVQQPTQQPAQQPSTDISPGHFDALRQYNNSHGPDGKALRGTKHREEASELLQSGRESSDNTVSSFTPAPEDTTTTTIDANNEVTMYDPTHRDFDLSTNPNRNQNQNFIPKPMPLRRKRPNK